MKTQAEMCRDANFTTDQLELMGATYQLIDDSNPWGWVFPDGSKGLYSHGEFKIIESDKPMSRLTIRELEILIKETVSNMNSSTILNGIKPEFLRGRMAQLMEYLTDYTIATYQPKEANND